MCGRFVVAKATSDLLPELFGSLPAPEPDYNVAPTASVAVVRERRQEHERRQEQDRESDRTLDTAFWGFVPTWAKDWKKQQPKPINARIETVSTSPMFRKSFAKHRVLVPASGYIEWTITETGKQPHYIFAPDAGLAMAGILSFWPDPTKDEDDPSKWRESMAIITRDAHVAPGEVHDRMPALVTPDAYNDWLGDHLDPADLLTLLDRESHAAAHDLTHFEISRDINSVRNTGEHLIDPLPGQP